MPISFTDYSILFYKNEIERVLAQKILKMNYLGVIDLFRLIDIRAGLIQTEASVISR